MILTILSSLAQDESRSISENSTWGIRRRFEQGDVLLQKTWNSTKEESGSVIGIIGEGEGLKEFDVDLYFRMVERMTVLGDEKVIVSFLDGPL